MQLNIAHKTSYTYDQPVDYALQKVRLRPLTSTLQNVIAWDITITGGKLETCYLDHYGNHIDLVSIDAGGKSLDITATGLVQTIDNAGVLGAIYGRAPLWHFTQETPLTRPNAQISALGAAILSDTSPLAGLHSLSGAVLEATPYRLGETGSDTTAENALLIGHGVCQDHSHIFCAAARSAGFPARYVSGYLMINDVIDQDASHAWAEVHIDGLGWVGFDVSNGVAPDNKYVRIAIGRDARDAAPISGMRIGNAIEAMIVSLQVQQ